MPSLKIVEVDPQGADALALLREAAIEARALYPEHFAAEFGYTAMRLETGNRQLSAIALYEKLGFRRIPPFGEYLNDPLSVCFETTVRTKPSTQESVNGI